MPARAVVGIDPGKEGGWAILPVYLGEFAPVVGALPYAPDDAQPLVRTLRAAIQAAGVRIVAVGVEYVNSFGMGRQSAFVFGQGVGALLALCELEGWPTLRPRPVQWQQTIGATRKGGEADPLGPVSRLFPTVPLVLPRCRKPHMGIVDALGIAEHIRRTAAAVESAAADPLPFG